MGDEKRVILTLPSDLVEKLDKYAEREYRGNRTIAAYQILKQFLEEKEEKQ